ncbi:MAG: SPW repeat protein [Alphaproteobacteria bacterium]|nr:SPW repeat protein [Alphaproteobacteria bacterium]
MPQKHKGPAYWKDVVNLIMGVWLLTSPWILAYSLMPTAAWNSWATGAIIALLAAASLFAYRRWEEWILIVLGIWVGVSPWILDFTTLPMAMWNHVIVGTIVTVLAVWATATKPKLLADS